MKFPRKPFAPLAICAARHVCTEGTREAIDLGTSIEVTRSMPWFRDAAAESGAASTPVRARTHRLWFPEIMSGGLALFDVGGDGASTSSAPVRAQDSTS